MGAVTCGVEFRVPTTQHHADANLHRLGHLWIKDATVGNDAPDVANCVSLLRAWFGAEEQWLPRPVERSVAVETQQRGHGSLYSLSDREKKIVTARAVGSRTIARHCVNADDSRMPHRWSSDISE